MAETLSSMGIDHLIIGYHFALFVLVWLFLTHLVFKPYFNAYVERSSRTHGGLEFADRILAETEELEKAFSAKARDLTQDHKSIFNKSRTEAMHEHDELVAKARQQAKHQVDSTRAQIEKEIDSARAHLSQEVPGVAKAIVGQLLGKEVSL